VDRTFPIDESTFFILNKRASEKELMAMILEILNGHSMGIISEAGCPGIADPGASLVALAHNHGIHVKPLVGPISFALALMSSGFSGQRFSFHGYLPKENRRHGDTHLFMDTPFRSMHVLEDLLNELSDQTELCLAVNLTLPNQRIQTMTIKEWRLNAFDINKAPAVFIIGTSQH
jgi:16S rRNA (cytidine1402-2'-O)-methyltransferase